MGPGVTEPFTKIGGPRCGREGSRSSASRIPAEPPRPALRGPGRVLRRVDGTRGPLRAPGRPSPRWGSPAAPGGPGRRPGGPKIHARAPRGPGPLPPAGAWAPPPPRQFRLFDSFSKSFHLSPPGTCSFGPRFFPFGRVFPPGWAAFPPDSLAPRGARSRGGSPPRPPFRGLGARAGGAPGQNPPGRPRSKGGISVPSAR